MEKDIRGRNSAHVLRVQNSVFLAGLLKKNMTRQWKRVLPSGFLHSIVRKLQSTLGMATATTKHTLRSSQPPTCFWRIQIWGTEVLLARAAIAFRISEVFGSWSTTRGYNAEIIAG